MAFKVQVGPAQIAIHQAQTVLLTEPDGQVNWPSTSGLYFRDTRVISAWAIYAMASLGTCSMAAPSPLMRRASSRLIAPSRARTVRSRRARWAW